MKGLATITVKDKNGVIKQQVTQHNVVFDIPKLVLNNHIQYDQKYAGTGFTSFPNENSTEWFGSICLYGESISETDPFDYKIPLLCGSLEARNLSANTRYTQYDSNNSSITGNTIVRRWDWTNVPVAVSISAISLKHREALWNTKSASSDYNSCPRCVELGNNYFLETCAGATTYPETAQYSYICTHMTTVDMQHQNCFDRQQIVKLGNNSPSNSGFGAVRDYGPSIYKLSSGEWLIGRYYDDMTTSDASLFISYIYIVSFDSTGITVHRKFAISDFLTGVTSIGRAMFGVTKVGSDYYVALYNSSTSNGIFKLPTTQTTPAASIASLPSMDSGVGHIVSMENGFIAACCSDSTNKSIIINSDLSIDQFDNVFNWKLESDMCRLKMINSHVFETAYGNSSHTFDDLWYKRILNSTALNFATPIAVAAGDTLSVVYTITAG